jgi:hypothetical protein
MDRNFPLAEAHGQRSATSKDAATSARSYSRGAKTQRAKSNLADVRREAVRFFTYLIFDPRTDDMANGFQEMAARFPTHMLSYLTQVMRST